LAFAVLMLKFEQMDLMGSTAKEFLLITAK
jgi:hypothetical protein